MPQKLNTAPAKTNEPSTFEKLDIDGLTITGIVKGRSRKFFPDTEKLRYSYILQSVKDKKDIIVNAWGDHSILPVGTHVNIPVSVRPYVDRAGQLRYNFILVSEKTLPEGEEEF